MTYPNYMFSIFSFVGFLMCAIPFPWHLEAWNTGTCLYMFWVGLGCLNAFINSVVWNDNAVNWAPVWCDISAKFIVGLGFAVPACSLCINRRLYRIASVKSVVVTKEEKRRAVIIDLCIGMGIPVIGMCLHYVVQGHRFNILEEIGCFPYTYPSIPAFFIMQVPNLIVGIIAAYYAIRSIIEFRRSRAQFIEFLSGHSNLTSDRYLRLMALAGLEVCCTIPLTLFFIIANAISGDVRPYKDWAWVHWGFHRVDQFPSILWRLNKRDAALLDCTRWLVVVCAFCFFLFFGFADEARKNYRSAFTSVTKKLGISSVAFASNVSGSTSGGAKSKVSSQGKPRLPVHVHKEMLQHRDSTSSFNVSIRDVGGLLGSSTADLDEKKATSSVGSFSPTQSYGGITLNDVGGLMVEKDDILASPVSPADTLAPPLPALTRSRPASIVEEPVQKAFTHDVV